jgi:hypothetical protein
MYKSDYTGLLSGQLATKLLSSFPLIPGNIQPTTHLIPKEDDYFKHIQQLTSSILNTRKDFYLQLHYKFEVRFQYI